ncbi:MAG: hypothetical protein QXI33_02285 [Candidatus Pacearchaeota archaeon]
MLLEELVLIGFERKQAAKLAGSEYFCHRSKTYEELTELFNRISRVYRCSSEEVKKAVLSFPPFAGYNHERVVRQGIRLGKMAGLSYVESIDYLLNSPILAIYSEKRYLAAFDIGRQLKREGFPQNKDMLEVFFSCIIKSPYVPNSDRERISKIIGGKEPPLLKAMRRKLKNL